MANYQKAINLTRSIGQKGEYFRAITFGYLALELFVQGKIDDAYQNAKKAMNLSESQGALKDKEMAQQLISKIQTTRKRDRSHE